MTKHVMLDESPYFPLRTGWRKHSVSVTQVMADFERHCTYLRKTAAFEEWRQKTNFGDRLPRGKYFRGKRAGRKIVVIDEFWRAGESCKSLK